MKTLFVFIALLFCCPVLVKGEDHHRGHGRDRDTKIIIVEKKHHHHHHYRPAVVERRDVEVYKEPSATVEFYAPVPPPPAFFVPMPVPPLFIPVPVPGHRH
jgi:hypothetical protein